MANQAPTTQGNMNPDRGGERSAQAARPEACSCVAAISATQPLTDHLMEQIVAKNNLRQAYRRIERCGVLAEKRHASIAPSHEFAMV